MEVREFGQGSFARKWVCLVDGIGGGGGENIPPYNGIKEKESADGGKFMHWFFFLKAEASSFDENEV